MEATNATAQGPCTPIDEDIVVVHCTSSGRPHRHCMPHIAPPMRALPDPSFFRPRSDHRNHISATFEGEDAIVSRSGGRRLKGSSHCQRSPPSARVGHTRNSSRTPLSSLDLGRAVPPINIDGSPNGCVARTSTHSTPSRASATPHGHTIPPFDSPGTRPASARHANPRRRRPCPPPGCAYDGLRQR
jgi:hypothetical protein